MSFLTKSIIPPPFLFRTSRNGVPKPSKKNWPTRKKSSTLVSDIIKISILSLIISAKESNLFRIELIFRCAKISLLRLSLRIVCRLEFVPDFDFSRHKKWATTSRDVKKEREKERRENAGGASWRVNYRIN